MKIAFITSHINKSTQWLWFSEELNKRKIEHIHIIISITKNPPLLVKDLEKIGIKFFLITHKNFISHLINLFKIIKILKKEKIDVVHTELPYGNLLGQISAFLCGIKKRVTTCENASWAFDFNNKKQILIDKITYTLSKVIITLTDLSKEYLISKFGLPKEKIVTIWHALKIEEYENISNERIEKIKIELGIKVGEFIIGMVARGEEWKGHIYAIKAIEKLIVKYENIKLIIIGVNKNDKYVKELIEYIESKKIDNNVLLVEFISDNIAMYKIFDIHIHVPINEMCETFGITYIEGMISGCPQIVTKSGIGNYIYENLKNSLIVDYKDEYEIANAIKYLINNAEIREYISKNSKNDAIKNFSYHKKVDKHIEIYNQIQ